MNTIWKYPLAVTDVQSVPMSTEAEILTVQAQDGTLYLWAMVNPEAIPQRCFIHLFGTGQPIQEPEKYSYIATAQTEGRVWHVFAEWEER